MTTLCEVRREEAGSLATLSLGVEGALARLGAPGRQVVFTCIGTDRSTGDALGPLVGQRLLRLGFPASCVVGTLEEPLHALNLRDRIGPLLVRPDRPLVVAIDAALGPSAGVGTVHLRDGGLLPGQGVGKDLPQVGELAITATVNIQAGAMDVQILQSTRLFVVQELAEMIAVACWWGHRSLARAAGGGRRAVAV